MIFPRRILSLAALLGCIAIPLASTATDATGLSYGVAMRDLAASKGTAVKGSPCSTAGAVAAATDGSAYLTCTKGTWLPPVNHTYNATFAHHGEPFMPGGFSTVIASGTSATGNLRDVGYGLCLPGGGLKAAGVSLGWYYSATPLPGDDVEFMASATTLDAGHPIPKTGCLREALPTQGARWDTLVTLKPGQSVTLHGSDGFTVTLTRGNDLPD